MGRSTAESLPPNTQQLLSDQVGERLLPPQHLNDYDQIIPSPYQDSMAIRRPASPLPNAKPAKLTAFL